MDRLFHPWSIDFVSLCSYLYRTFIYMVIMSFTQSTTLMLHWSVITLEILQTLTTY